MIDNVIKFPGKRVGFKYMKGQSEQINSMCAHNDLLYVATDKGLFSYDHKTDTWEKIGFLP